uniref:Uncharacterized protein n=1 Tax=Sus scrofa TaxID=9823 RepID=A0A4X1ULD8_PIG
MTHTEYMGGVNTDTPASKSMPSRPPAVLLLSYVLHLSSSPASFTWHSPPLSPLTQPLSPISRTVIVFIFILIEEAEALQGMLHSDAKTRGPASSQALSLLDCKRSQLCHPCPAALPVLPQPSTGLLTMSRLSSRVTSCSRPCSSGN